ncbi:MAG: Eco57I restriction-modification methylase domain-containing protein [Verrucomicrobiota bacterium]
MIQSELSKIRLRGDLVIAAFFEGKNQKEREQLRLEYMNSILQGNADTYRGRLEEWRNADPPLVPFHWEIEFPEVFARENSGFDAIVGNPPSAGKKLHCSRKPHRIPSTWLKHSHKHAHGNSDLVAHFFRPHLQPPPSEGAFGLIATNTIGQGNTRAPPLPNPTTPPRPPWERRRPRRLQPRINPTANPNHPPKNAPTVASPPPNPTTPPPRQHHPQKHHPSQHRPLAAPTLGAPTSPSAPTPHQPHCQPQPPPKKRPHSCFTTSQSHHPATPKNTTPAAPPRQRPPWERRRPRRLTPRINPITNTNHPPKNTAPVAPPLPIPPPQQRHPQKHHPSRTAPPTPPLGAPTSPSAHPPHHPTASTNHPPKNTPTVAPHPSNPTTPTNHPAPFPQTLPFPDDHGQSSGTRHSLSFTGFW